MQIWMQLLLALIALGAIAYLLLCIALLIWQNRLIFFPSAVLKNTPEKLKLPYDEVHIPIVIGIGRIERLHGWWIPAASRKSDVLLYLHGNGGNISANLGHAKRFHKLGFSVLLFDYRGYGRSTEKFPTEAEVYRDAQAAWDYLVQQRRIEPRNIFIYGHSLGGAIAIDLAVRRPHAAGLMIENAFPSIGILFSRQGIYQFLPVKWLLGHRFDSLSKLKLLQVPLLLIHGQADRKVSARMSQTLYEAAKVSKKLLLVPHAGHNNVAIVGGEDYLHAIGEFYQNVRHNQYQLAEK